MVGTREQSNYFFNEEGGMHVEDVVAVVMGGGVGSRLYPLTRDRTKPAVPLAGKYRLIDIPMSNCFNAGIDKIAILTQFNSVSLHRHITRTYARDIFARGWVQILAAEQTYRSGEWYQGTADAIRKQIIELRSSGAKYILILAGDHLYRMDYAEFINFHVESEADITIAVQPVDRESASAFGILKLDEDASPILSKSPRMLKKEKAWRAAMIRTNRIWPPWVSTFLTPRKCMISWKPIRVWISEKTSFPML